MTDSWMPAAPSAGAALERDCAPAGPLHSGNRHQVPESPDQQRPRIPSGGAGPRSDEGVAGGAGLSLRQGLASSTRYSTWPELDRLATAYEAAIERAAGVEVKWHSFRDFIRGRPCRAGSTRPGSRMRRRRWIWCGLAQAAAEGLWSEPQLSDDTTLEIEEAVIRWRSDFWRRWAAAFIANDRYVGDDRAAFGRSDRPEHGRQARRSCGRPRLHCTYGTDRLLQAGGARADRGCRRRCSAVELVPPMISRPGVRPSAAEMLKTSGTLNQATERSLVILDEVGRGTATHDGFVDRFKPAWSISTATWWAAEQLFATHFHELAEAVEAMPNAVCMTMDASAGRHDEMVRLQGGSPASPDGRMDCKWRSGRACCRRRSAKRAAELLARPSTPARLEQPLSSWADATAGEHLPAESMRIPEGGSAASGVSPLVGEHQDPWGGVR